MDFFKLIGNGGQLEKLQPTFFQFFFGSLHTCTSCDPTPLTVFVLLFVYRYRKVSGDTCHGGMEDQFAAVMASCPINRK